MDTVFFLLFCSLFAKKRKEISIPAFHIRRYTTYFYYVRKKETQLLSSNLPEFSHWFQNPRLKLHLLSKTIARLYKGVFAHAKKSSNECAFSRVQSRNLMVLFSNAFSLSDNSWEMSVSVIPLTFVLIRDSVSNGVILCLIELASSHQFNPVFFA